MGAIADLCPCLNKIQFVGHHPFEENFSFQELNLEKNFSFQEFSLWFASARPEGHWQVLKTNKRSDILLFSLINASCRFFSVNGCQIL